MKPIIEQCAFLTLSIFVVAAQISHSKVSYSQTARPELPINWGGGVLLRYAQPKSTSVYNADRCVLRQKAKRSSDSMAPGTGHAAIPLVLCGRRLSTHSFSIASSRSAQENAGLIAHKGRYRNWEYGYSVRIPKGLVGTSSSPPLPQHGIAISLASDPESTLWVDGSYNASMWRTLQEALEVDLDSIHNSVGEVIIVAKKSICLQQMKALRTTIRYKAKETGRIWIEEIIVAIRNRGKEVAIVYELGLKTPEDRFVRDNRAFEALLKSWRLEKLPR